MNNNLFTKFKYNNRILVNKPITQSNAFRLVNQHVAVPSNVKLQTTMSNKLDELLNRCREIGSTTTSGFGESTSNQHSSAGIKTFNSQSNLFSNKPTSQRTNSKFVFIKADNKKPSGKINMQIFFISSH